MIPKPGVLEQVARSANILVVDDDRRVRELLEIALTAHGFAVLTAADGDALRVQVRLDPQRGQRAGVTEALGGRRRGGRRTGGGRRVGPPFS